MRTLFLPAVFAPFAAIAAQAADMPIKARPLPPPAAFSWTGCHIGGNAGGKWATTSGSVDVAAANGVAGPTAAGSLPLAEGTLSSGIGGVQLGCDYQMGAFVYGVEGDAEWGNWTASRIVPPPIAAAPFPFIPGDSFGISSRWENSVRSRIGYAWDRWMLYVTGGVSWINVRVDTNYIAARLNGINFPAAVTSDSATLTGGTFGGGLEFAMTNNLIAGVEGRFAWYDGHTYNGGLLATSGFPPNGPFTFAPSTTAVHMHTSRVVGRLSWKF
jgi:outer membrane immunogenic protein